MKWELEKEIKLPAALGLSTLPHSESLLVSCFDGSILRVDPRESTWETLGHHQLCLQGWFRCWTAPWPSVRDTMVSSNGITWVVARPWLSKRSTISGPGSSRLPPMGAWSPRSLDNTCAEVNATNLPRKKNLRSRFSMRRPEAW